MDFIYKEVWLDHNQAVQVQCSHQCNMMLLNDTSFQNYRNGRQFNYFGGFYKQFPAQIIPPSSGKWHFVLDIGGGRANIQYKINIVTI